MAVIVILINNDELKIYRGEDYVINQNISIHQPTLGEICDFGEQNYYHIIRLITATPTDLKYQLHLSGLDWNEVNDYELFLMNYKAFTTNYTDIIFGDIDFTKYELKVDIQNDEICLYNPKNDSVIDRSIYELIVGYLRKSHNLKKNVERAMTQTTKEVLIEEAKEQCEANMNKEYKSFLLPLISTMISMDGFNYNHETIWNMKINAFMDAVNRIQKIKMADILLQSGHSGFGVDLKKIDKKQLNYFSEFDD